MADPVADTTPRTPEAPRRGLEYVKPLPPDDQGNACFEALCDCATTTILHIQIDGQLGAGAIGHAEGAFTCDGCGTSHWFKLTAGTDGSDG